MVKPSRVGCDVIIILCSVKMATPLRNTGEDSSGQDVVPMTDIEPTEPTGQLTLVKPKISLQQVIKAVCSLS